MVDRYLAGDLDGALERWRVFRGGMGGEMLF